MSFFEVELTDGRKFQVEANTQPTADEVVGFLNKTQSGQQQLSPSQNTQFLPGADRVNRLASQRKDSVQRLREEVNIPMKFGSLGEGAKSLFVKAPITTAKLAGIIPQRAESALAGAGLALQKQQGFGEAGRRFGEGLRGERTNEAGDVIRTTGFGGEWNDYLAGTAGFMSIMVSPIAAIKRGTQFLGKVSKFGDKGLRAAGNQIVKGTDEAVGIIGKRVDKAYAPINKVGVDDVRMGKMAEDVGNLEPVVIKHIERNLGEDLGKYLTEDFNIEKARKLKQLIGDLRQGAYGKETVGANVLISDKNVNKAYATIKKSMQETLENNGLKKEASELLKVDEAFTEAANSAKFVKKAVVDKTLKKPTKIGSATKKLKAEGDLSMREALSVLKSAGGKARVDIDKAVTSLNRYSNILLAGKFGQSVGRAAIIGGVGGQVASKTFGKFGQDDFGSQQNVGGIQ